MIRQFENLQFDNKSNLGIIQITGQRCTHSGPPVKLRFTALYTFPPLYTQKPAARRVFVFSEGGLRCPAFASGVAAPSQKTDRGPAPPPCLVRRTRSAALPAARRVFVFSVDGLRCPAFASGVAAPSQKTDRGPSAASLPESLETAKAPVRLDRGPCHLRADMV